MLSRLLISVASGGTFSCIHNLKLFGSIVLYLLYWFAEYLIIPNRRVSWLSILQNHVSAF